MFIASLKDGDNPKVHQQMLHKQIVIYIQWNIIQPLKGGNSAICNNMDGPGGYYAK